MTLVQNLLLRSKLLPFLQLLVISGLVPIKAIPTSSSEQPPTVETPEFIAIRHQVAEVKSLMPTLPDRGGALYFLAWAMQHLGRPAEALAYLRDCLLLEEGFDPSGSESLKALSESPDILPLIKNLHAKFPIVSTAQLAYTTKSTELVPEGLAYDPRTHRFYLSSLNLRTIVSVSRGGAESAFAQTDQRAFLPILGIRWSPTDGTIWAASWAEASNTSELLHFDEHGANLGRYQLKDGIEHGFNDLVVIKGGDVIVTDSVANQIYRFNLLQESFQAVKTHRSLFNPNGLALDEKSHSIYVADDVGVIQLKIQKKGSRDLTPGFGATLAGVDGLYWYKGSLIAVQNGIGEPRLAAFRLSTNGSRVLRTTILENRTPFTVSPTTGAIVGDRFYFIANSQGENMDHDQITNPATLAPIRIGVIRLP